jgi:hypothetical protein
MSTLTASATRIDAHIAKCRNAIEDKIASGELTEEKLNQFNKSLDIDFSEFTTFQDLKSQAMLSGKLSEDEAMQIYRFLGEGGPGKFNGLELAVKSTLTTIFAELLALRIGGKL